MWLGSGGLGASIIFGLDTGLFFYIQQFRFIGLQVASDFMSNCTNKAIK